MCCTFDSVTTSFLEHQRLQVFREQDCSRYNQCLWPLLPSSSPVTSGFGNALFCFVFVFFLFPAWRSVGIISWLCAIHPANPNSPSIAHLRRLCVPKPRSQSPALCSHNRPRWPARMCVSPTCVQPPEGLFSSAFIPSTSTCGVGTHFFIF